MAPPLPFLRVAPSAPTTSALKGTTSVPMTSITMLPYALASPCSTYASWDSTLSPAINFISTDPCPESRLADWGYVDQGGRWRRIINLLDEVSCRVAKIRPLQLAVSRSEYTTEKQQKPHTDPAIVLSNLGQAKIFEPDVFAMYAGLL
jgi:hypothetical protein